MANPTRNGFTLIELLVVIAIIAILASMLLPVLHQLKKKADLTYCMNNMRQIGLAIATYAESYNGVYPMTADSGNTGTALGLLYPGNVDDMNVFHCRADRGPGRKVSINATSGLLEKGSYAYAAYGGHTGNHSMLEIVADRDVVGLESNHAYEKVNILCAGLNIIQVEDKDKTDKSFDMPEDNDDLAIEDDIGDSTEQGSTDAFLGAAE